MRNRFLNTLLLLALGLGAMAQASQEGQPKLVVGIVVDQMRFDYLYRFESKYSENGFKRLMREGYNFKNLHYNYGPTVTAAGHASIYTGTTPSVHGIVGNSWYDRYLHSGVENVSDTTYSIVGSENSNKYGKSPKNLLATTISDQLRLGSNFKSKVISISLKDRGAILPGGHTANAAYWYDWQTSPGYFVSSSYYFDELPSWVKAFNREEKADSYMKKEWKTLLPIENYTESTSDDSPYERILKGKSSPTFPYNLPEMREAYKEANGEYELLRISPGGNSIVTDFALAAIKNENLGKDRFTDLINISYSTTDVVGHSFGPNSIEIEDLYLRLDQDIAELLNYLDAQVGKGNYILFLTADHAVVPNLSFLNDNKLPSGFVNIYSCRQALSQFLNEKYGESPWVEYFGSREVYLNRELINERPDIELGKIQLDAANFLLDQKGISSVATAHQLQYNAYSQGAKKMSQNGFFAKRSGDIILTFHPGFYHNNMPGKQVNDAQGTTHGSTYNYDTHVPMLWFGSGIPSGQSSRKVKITDIAPSLAMILNLQLPSGASGDPLYEILQED